MKKLFILWVIFVFCVLLCACGTQRGLVVTPTNSPVPSVTFTATVAPTLTRTPKPTFTVTTTVMPSETPFPTKQVLLDYYTVGAHTFFDSARDYTFSYLTVYKDGKIIISGENGYLQKQLSAGEIDQFFAKLKSLGFYALETDEDGHATDSLYTPDNPFARIYDASADCILTTNQAKPRDICAYEPYAKFLVPGMKNSLKFLDTYHPDGMKPYTPDRILLTSVSPEYFEKDHLPANAIPWPEQFPPLEATSSTRLMVYLQGSMATKISAYLDSVRSNKLLLFSQNGKEFVVMIDILLPHEAVYSSGLQP